MSTLSVTTITGANTIKSGTASTPPTIQDSNGTQVGTFCRAWVNFNGTGTVAIRASFNVTSITDNGTGDYTINFTNAISDANYSVHFGGTSTTSDQWQMNLHRNNTTPDITYTASAVRIFTKNQSATLVDSIYASVAVFR